MGVSGQRHAPAAHYPREKNPRYPLDRRLGGPRLDAKDKGKILRLCRDQIPVVQSVVRHYTDWATADPARG
jgi:hypothetical protein